MALGKGTAGARLEVPLETCGRADVSEFKRDNERPGTMIQGYAGGPGVVPAEAFRDVGRQAYVMAFRIGVAAKDVDERSWLHARRKAGTRPEQATAQMRRFLEGPTPIWRFR